MLCLCVYVLNSIREMGYYCLEVRNSVVVVLSLLCWISYLIMDVFDVKFSNHLFFCNCYNMYLFLFSLDL